MEKHLVSVIIPVYNAEKYLKKCIYSVINQTYKQIEIIVVDDGSTDNSKVILEKIIAKNNNVKYFYKTNGGQGSARNLGMSKAKGKYLMFVDADDWIDKEMIEELIAGTGNGKYNLVMCGIKYVFSNSIKEIKPTEGNSVESYLTDYLLSSPCNKLYERKLINNVEFIKEKIKYEDLLFNLIIASKTELKIKKLYRSYYNYNRENECGTINNVSVDVKDILLILTKSLKHYKANKLFSDFYNEIEYVCIHATIITKSLVVFKEKNYNWSLFTIEEIRTFLDENFPHWNKNKYLMSIPIKSKTVVFLFKHRLYFIFRIINYISRRQ